MANIGAYVTASRLGLPEGFSQGDIQLQNRLITLARQEGLNRNQVLWWENSEAREIATLYAQERNLDFKEAFKQMVNENPQELQIIAQRNLAEAERESAKRRAKFKARRIGLAIAGIALIGGGVILGGQKKEPISTDTSKTIFTTGGTMKEQTIEQRSNEALANLKNLSQDLLGKKTTAQIGNIFETQRDKEKAEALARLGGSNGFFSTVGNFAKENSTIIIIIVVLIIVWLAMK